MANNLFDYFKDFQNPFAGVGETFKEMNILGVTTPENVKQMESLGLLESDQIQAAKTRGLRDAIVQGLIAYGSQDFNKNLGTAFAPAYLLPALGVAMKTAQEPVSKLPEDVMNLEKLKTFKRETEKGAKVRELFSQGIFKKTTDEQGNVSFDPNYDIVDELVKANDIDSAKDIQSIIASKATALNAAKDKYKIVQQGNRVFYLPKDGVGPTKEMTEKGLITSKYEAKPEDKYIPDIRETQAFAQFVEGQFKFEGAKVGADEAKNMAYDVFNDAVQMANKPNETRTVNQIGMDLIRKRFNVTPKSFAGITTKADIEKNFGANKETPIQVTSKEQYNALPDGAWVRTPNGTIKQKQGNL